MGVIYTEPHFRGKDARGCGYERYIREVYCTSCGKKIASQTKYTDSQDFFFDDREKKDYKFCPYCGTPIKE